MEKLIFLFFIMSPLLLFAEPKAVVLKKWTLPFNFKVNKKRIGGLSGCTVSDNKIHFISDDRGNQGGPRIVSFDYDILKNEIIFENVSVIKINSGRHHNLDSKLNSKLVSKILDLEGIGLSAKNLYLVSNEGDLNQKPRVMPEIFWLNSRGERLNSILFPDMYLPEKSGKQTKGIQNNLGFEGLVIDNELNKWAAILEAPLLQIPGKLSLVESTLGGTTFERVYFYPVPTELGAQVFSGYFGVTDLLILDNDSYLVLERGIEASLAGITYKTQLCRAKKTNNANLIKDCFYSMNSDPKVTGDFKNGANFEGLCWVNNQKKLFITVSDNNFSKNEKTVFILYQLQ